MKKIIERAACGCYLQVQTIDGMEVLDEQTCERHTRELMDYLHRDEMLKKYPKATE